MTDKITGAAPDGPARKTIKIKQIGSPIRRPEAQKKILIGLGLGKMNRVVEILDNAETRGAIAKLPHMVAVVE